MKRDSTRHTPRATRNRFVERPLHSTEWVGDGWGRGIMRDRDNEPSHATNWGRTGIKASILLVLLIGTVFGITQAIILLALYAIIVIPL